MKERLESGSCSGVGIRERIGQLPPRPERQAEAREGGVDHRPVEVRERLMMDAAPLLASAVVPLLRKISHGGRGGQRHRLEGGGGRRAAPAASRSPSPGVAPRRSHRRR